MFLEHYKDSLHLTEEISLNIEIGNKTPKTYRISHESNFDFHDGVFPLLILF